MIFANFFPNFFEKILGFSHNFFILLRLGSLENSRVIPEETRPHLGLKIVSPEKSKPIKVLEQTLNTTFTKQERKDIKQILTQSKTKSANDLKALLKKHLEHRVSKEHEHTVNIEDEFVTSILEATTQLSDTFTKSPVKNLNLGKYLNFQILKISSSNDTVIISGRYKCLK